jgi:dCMP deaminase
MDPGYPEFDLDYDEFCRRNDIRPSLSPNEIKFMRMARTVAQCSKARNQHRGAILVRDNTVISTGYNGFPRGVSERGMEIGRFPSYIQEYIVRHPDFNEDNDARELLGYGPGTGVKWCIDAHCELNCIINAARIGVSTIGSDMYAWCSPPCIHCAIAIIQAGISRVYCLSTGEENVVDYLNIRMDKEKDVSEWNPGLAAYLMEIARVKLIPLKITEELLENGGEVFMP